VSVGDHDGGVAILIVDDGLFGDGEYILVLFEDDFGVCGHVGFEFAAGVVDGDLDFEGGDVVFFDAEGSDLGDLTDEGLAGEALDLNAGGLAHVYLADVGLVDLALDVDLVGVAEGHDEGGGGAEDEDGADGVAHLYVAGENYAVDGRDDGGVAELLFQLLERGLGLENLGFSLALLGGVYFDLGESFVADVDGGEVLLLRVVESLLGDYAVFRHLEGAVVAVLEVGEIGGLGGYFVELDRGFGGVSGSFGGGELGLLGGYLIEDFLLVELSENLALVDGLVDVGGEAGDDAAGFGFDLDLRDGPDLAGSDHGTGDVSGFDLAELGGVDFGGAAEGFGSDDAAGDEDKGNDAEDDPKTFAGFTRRSQWASNGAVESGRHYAGGEWLVPWLSGSVLFEGEEHVGGEAEDGEQEGGHEERKEEGTVGHEGGSSTGCEEDLQEDEGEDQDF